MRSLILRTNERHVSSLIYNLAQPKKCPNTASRIKFPRITHQNIQLKNTYLTEEMCNNTVIALINNDVVFFFCNVVELVVSVQLAI